MHTITIETSPYDAKQYSTPYIFKIIYSLDGGQAEYDWGNWTGCPGGNGILKITAETGEIVSTGQADLTMQAPRYTIHYRVKPDGSLAVLGRDDAAYKYFLEKNRNKNET